MSGLPKIWGLTRQISLLLEQAGDVPLNRMVLQLQVVVLLVQLLLGLSYARLGMTVDLRLQQSHLTQLDHLAKCPALRPLKRLQV